MAKRLYCVPCIIFCSVLVSANKRIAANPDRITKIMKKSYRSTISKPAKTGAAGSAGSGYKALSVPANLLAAAMDENQMPINNEANFAGDSLTTIAKPMGDKHNSPMVCSKYKLNSHIMLTLVAGSTPLTPKAITQ